MAFTQVAAPNFNALVSGNANLFLLQALGFSSDSRVMLVHASFADSAVQPTVTQQSIWLYDIESRSYISNLNNLLTQDPVTYRELDLRNAAMAGPSNQNTLILEYQLRGSSEPPKLALVKDGVLIQRDLLDSLLGPGAQVRVERFELSADERYLAIQTSSAALAKEQEPDSNEVSDIYLIDLNNLETQPIQRISALGAFEANQPSLLGGVYADAQGVSVLFATDDNFSKLDQNGESTELLGRSDAYLWRSGHNATGLLGQSTISLASAPGVAALAAGGVETEALWLTKAGAMFNSSATNLIANDTNQAVDAFLRTPDGGVSRVDLDGQVELAQGAQVLSSSTAGSLLVLLTTLPEDTSMSALKLVLSDTRTNKWTVISENNRPADDSAFAARLSPNGSVLAFNSNATNLVAGQDNSAIGGQLFLTETELLDVTNAAPTGNVTISGTATPGQLLTAANTLGDIDGLSDIRYQWLANGSAINGATNNTLVLTPDLAGQQISLRASYTDLQGTPESVDSASLKVNTPPMARNNSYTIAEDVSLVLGNVITDGWALGTPQQTVFRDTDADEDILIISAVTVDGVHTTWADLPDSTDPADLSAAESGNVWKAIALPNGTAWLQASGTLRYAAKANDSLGDTLGYTLSDGRGGTSSASVQIKVLPIDDPASAVFSVSGTAQSGGSLSLTTSQLSDPDGTPSLAYQWQWLDGQNWQNISEATEDTWSIPADTLWANRTVRAQIITTDPLGGQNRFFSEPQVIEVGSQLLLSVNHWKSGQALAGVGVGLYKGAEELKTGPDGWLNAKDFPDTDGQDDGKTLLTPNLAITSNQARITLTDVLGALKVYLGKPLPDAYNSDLKFVAADFDGNGNVNLSDVLGLLKFYLNKPVNVAPAWVFLDNAQTTPINGQLLHLSNKVGQTLSTSSSTPAPILVDLYSDEPIQLVGVLRGDLDGSFSV